MGAKRIFLACEISEDVRSEIEHIEKHFAELKFALRFTSREKLHITLAFLPRVGLEKLPQISAVTKKICSQFSPISANLVNLAAFPNLKLPRIIYINLAGETVTLSNLARKIQHGIEVLGFQFDHQRFLPHITIARTKSYVNNVERRRLGETIQRWGKINQLKFSVNSISILESVPTSAGHVHVLLEKINLG